MRVVLSWRPGLDRCWGLPRGRRRHAPDHVRMRCQIRSATWSEGNAGHSATMRAVEARNLWLGELSTNGVSPWTIRNYTSATDAAFTTTSKRRQVASGELGAIDRNDMVAPWLHTWSGPSPRG